MSTEPAELGSTNVRITFRTFRAYVQKLRRIAKTNNLRIGGHFSVGQALNMIIGKYDEAAGRTKRSKKGTRR